MKKLFNGEPETECYICKNVTTTMVNTHGIRVCPDCTRRIVHNHVADLMTNEITGTINND